MKLWIIGLAIATMSGCGHQESAEETSVSNTGQSAVQPTPSQPQQQQQPGINPDPKGIVMDTGATPPPGAPPGDPNAPKPGRPEKPKPRPKPQVIEYTK